MAVCKYSVKIVGMYCFGINLKYIYSINLLVFSDLATDILSVRIIVMLISWESEVAFRCTEATNQP